MVAEERHCPYAELSRLRLAKPPPLKSGLLARTYRDGGLSPQLPLAAGGCESVIAAAKS